MILLLILFLFLILPQIQEFHMIQMYQLHQHYVLIQKEILFHIHLDFEKLLLLIVDQLYSYLLFDFFHN
jgi:hypothetical protein